MEHSIKYKHQYKHVFQLSERSSLSGQMCLKSSHNCRRSQDLLKHLNALLNVENVNTISSR